MAWRGVLVSEGIILPTEGKARTIGHNKRYTSYDDHGILFIQLFMSIEYEVRMSVDGVEKPARRYINEVSLESANHENSSTR